MIKKNPNHKKRANESWWHILTLIAVGYILRGFVPVEDIVTYIKESLGLTQDLVRYAIDNAVGIVALVSIALKLRDYKKRSK